LSKVVGAARELPLGVAGGQPAAGEPAGALLLLELPEGRLDGLLPQGIASLALLAAELGEHRGAQPLALRRSCQQLAQRHSAQQLCPT
jgi:hypothetical protein